MNNIWNTLNTKTVKGTFLTQLEEGDNIVRVAGAPKLIQVHYPKDSFGSIGRVNCPGNGCPLCANNESVQTKCQFPIIDREDGEARILEVAITAASGIKKLANKYGDPTTYDINIKRTGSGKNTKYTVSALEELGKSRLTDDEKEKVDNLSVSSKLIEPTPIEEINDKYFNIW